MEGLTDEQRPFYLLSCQKLCRVYRILVGIGRLFFLQDRLVRNAFFQKDRRQKITFRLIVFPNIFPGRNRSCEGIAQNAIFPGRHDFLCEALVIQLCSVDRQLAVAAARDEDNVRLLRSILHKNKICQIIIVLFHALFSCGFYMFNITHIPTEEKQIPPS